MKTQIMNFSLGSNLSRISLASLICLCLLTISIGNVWGADATVQLQSNLGLSNSSTFSSTTQNSVTLSGAKGGNSSNPPKYYTSGDAVRFYAKNTMTVEHASGMTKIVVNYGSKSNAISSASVGSIGSYSSNKQTWTGDATSVTFTFDGTSGNDQITSVVVTPKGASSTVVWTINPAAGGSLSATSGTSTTVTPNSAYTYGSPAYTVTTGSASVVQSTNTFTATPSANCTICINMVEKLKYTVTLEDNDETLTQASAGASVILPPRTGCTGYTFAGWTKTWDVAQTTWTTTAPTIIPAGSYTPSANENLYPVYTKEESGGSTSYVLTAATAVTAGTYVIGITGSSGYYIATGLSGSTNVDMAVNTSTDVTLTNNAFTTLPTGGMELTFTGNNTDGFTISNSGGDKLSYSSYTSRRLSFDATGKTWKVIEDDSKLVLQSYNSDGYYTISQNGTNSIRGYANNTKYNTLYLFKKTGGSTTYYISVPDCGDPCEKLGSATGLTVVTDFEQDGQTYVKFSWTPAAPSIEGTTQKLCYGLVGQEKTCTVSAKHLGEAKDVASNLPAGEYEWSIQAIGDGNNYCDGDVVNGTNFYIYSITYNTNGGNTIAATSGTTLPDPLPTPTREHYNFEGWYTNSELTIAATAGAAITQNTTLYAKWTAKTYTITFNAGTGECGTESVSTTNAIGVTLPTASHTCTDWTFAGWWTGSVAETTTSPGELLTAGSNYKPASDCTLYAVYSYTETGGGGSVTFDFSNIATANSWTNGTAYTTVTISPITLNAIGGGNNGKYYTSNTSWRMYDDGSLQISTDIGKITSVSSTPDKTFTINDEGTATLSFTATTEFKSITVSYSSTTTTYNSNPTCLEPVWNGATIDKTSFTVNCGERSPMTGATNGAAIISFPTEDIRNFTKDITIEATTGFLVSTNQSEDANYQSSVSLSPLVGTGNANTFYNKHVYVRAEAPAQSDTDLEGTITIKNNKGETLQTFSVTADVTCTQYTLTLVDRGVSTEQPTKYYAGETIDEAPADPEGVCTDPIHYVFDGWAEAEVNSDTTSYSKVSFPYEVTGNTKFYAVYRYVEEGSGDGNYYLVENDLGSQWAGEYLIVSGTKAFDGSLSSLDVTGNNFDVTISNKTIEATDEINQKTFTIKSVEEYYTIQSKSGKYIGAFATGNLNNNTEVYDDRFYHTLGIGSPNNKALIYSNKGDGVELQTNGGRFRYYTKNNQTAVYLYKKADGTTYYTTSPVCGPHLAITEGKDIYVTGGNAGGTRDLVIAQQKVSYKATRLQTSNGLDNGAAPDVKVATNGITVGGVVTQDVKVAIDQTEEQQTDGTYTITGTITVQYQPSANNKQEDIQVQLAVDYNAEARDNFTVHARSLPAEFVIVAKSGDKWYALNGDMNTNAANPANGQVTLDAVDNPTKATFAPCNTIYTFDGLPNTGDRTYVRFQGTDGAWLWASSGTNVGIQNNVLKTTPEGNNNAYNWKLYTEDNITYRFGNANSSRQLTLSGEKFGMYASGVQEFRILPYEAKCLYNYAPTNLKVSVLKGTYVTLTWDAVAGATKYQYSTNGTTWTDAGTDPTVTINGLTGATEYTYYIRAYHEDVGVSQECIDYAEITFTTANCDDVPTDITYTADLNSITVSWTAADPTATIKYNTKEDFTGGGGTINNATSPHTISGGLNPNTTYYIQILAGGTCASPIIPVKTKDVEVDIVEWKTDSIVVDVNTNEKISVTLENEVSFGSGLGSLAEDLFFSKYFEGSGSLKMIAIYNGTGKDVDLSGYRIDRGSNGNATNISKTYDLSQLGIIKQGQEIIFYSWPLTSEYSYDCSQSFLDSKVQESGLDANPRWILCDAKTHNDIVFEAMDFSGNDPLLLYKSSELIDVFGVSTEQESPASTQICSGRSDEAWSAAGVTNMDYGKTTEDFPNGEIPHGVNVDDETITAYTARVIMFRKNTVVSGTNAVTKNTDTFATFAEEWEARQVCMSGDDGDLTCAAYQELGTFDYSDYYTKYVSMGDDQVFEENKRNPDGTVAISIPELSKQSCRNIRIIIKDNNDEVISNQEYKVPIMITTTQGTDGQTFLDLQQNLATVEVDGSGNPTGNKTNLTLEQVREICKTCDVVVRDNATLTKVTDGTTNDHPQVHNVYVYEGASIVIPDGVDHNYTINGLSLRRKGDVVASAQVQGTGKFVLPADEPVCLDLRVDANNWHWFTLPYDCDIADVTWIDGTPAKYNTDWFLMYYDGESRAASTNPHDNHWKVYNGTTIEAGKGYIVGITGDLTHPNYTFELRFPMAQEVLTAEQTNKTVPVNAWGVQSDNTPNNLGWNLVGNPYLNYYETADGYSLAGLPLIRYIDTDPVTGEWYYEYSGGVPYVVTPIDGGWYEYQQELASGVNLMPFTAYFVQVGDPETHTNGQALYASFEASNRGKKSIVRRAPREVEEIEEPIIVRVELTNSKGESDKTSLVIDDRFTNEYEMNGDFFKWFGDYYNYYTKPVLYTIGADQGKRAFNALNEELAKQPIPMGMYAAQAGNYTFSLNQQFDLSRVEEVWLYDATQSTYTNLMQSDYTFSTSKVNGAGRFSLSVKLAPKVATSIDNVTADKVWATTHAKQVIVNGLENGMHLWLYDATGKLLYNEPTSNYQHTYSVPQTGTYFVSVMKGNAKQTIKVVVE